MLVVRLFGPPAFFYRDEEVLFPSRKTLALFCYLLVERKVSREKAAGLLWSERNEEAAHKNLRNTLYLLKKTLPEALVLSDRQWISLAVCDKIQTDLEKLDDIETMSVGQCMNFVHPFLEGLYLKDCPVYDDWLQQTRYIYEERAARALKKKVEGLYGKGFYEDGMSLIQAYYARNRLDEDACRLLMIACGRQNKENKVRELFRELELNLKKELGTVPGNLVKGVYEDLVKNCVSLSEKTSLEEGLGRARGADWFYGRQSELNEIASFFQGSSEAARCLLVTGEAGVGKSRLVEKYLEDERDGVILYGRTMEEGRELPLFPFNDLAKNLAAKVEMRSFSGALPERVKMVLGEAFPALNLEVSYESASYSRIGLMLAEFFRILSKRLRIRVVLEDLQWFDDASLKVLESFLGGNPGGIEIFMTARPDVNTKITKALKSFDGMGLLESKTINLQSFDMEEVKRFCREALEDERLTDQTIRKLYEYSGGLPLYLKSYLDLIRQGKPIEEIPDNVREAVERTLAGLEDRERQILECMSVFLNETGWDLLVDVCDCDAESLAEAAESLCRKGIIREFSPEPDGRLFLGFRHSKVKEHVYGSLSEAKRRTLHQRLAGILKADSNRDLWKDFEGSRIIFHCRRAGMILDELYFSLKRLDFQTRLNYELFPLLDDDTLRRSSAAFEDIGETKRRFIEAKELLGKVRDKFGETDDYRKLEMTYRTLLGGYLVWWGDHGRGGNFLKSSLEWATLKNEKSLELKSLQNLCYLFIQTEEGQNLDSVSSRYLCAAESCFDEAAYGAALRFKGLAATFTGKFDKALEYFGLSSKCFEDMEATGGQFTLQKEAARKYKGEICHKRGFFDGAVKHFTECLEHCESMGIHRGSFSFHSNLAHVYFDMDEPDLAKIHVSKALDFMEERKWWRGNSVVFSIKAMLSLAEKDERQALEYLKKADDLSCKLNKKYWLALQLLVKGMMKKSKIESGELRAYLFGQGTDYFGEAGKLYKAMGIDFMAEKVEKMRESFTQQLRKSW